MRKLMLLAVFVAAFFVAEAQADDLYRAVTTHRGDASNTVLHLPAFDPDGRNRFQSGVDGIQVFMTASGYVSVGVTPFASAASNPVAVPANTIVRLKASGSDIVSIRLDTGGANVIVTEISE